MSPAASGRHLKMSAARRRKSCSCWLLPELIPLLMMASRGSTRPRTSGLPACRATNTSTRSSTCNRRRDNLSFPSACSVEQTKPLRGELRAAHLDLKVSDQHLLLLQLRLLVLLGLSLFLLLGEQRRQALVQLHHGFVIQILITAAVLLRGLMKAQWRTFNTPRLSET